MHKNKLQNEPNSKSVQYVICSTQMYYSVSCFGHYKFNFNWITSQWTHLKTLFIRGFYNVNMLLQLTNTHSLKPQMVFNFSMVVQFNLHNSNYFHTEQFFNDTLNSPWSSSLVDQWTSTCCSHDHDGTQLNGSFLQRHLITSWILPVQAS